MFSTKNRFPFLDNTIRRNVFEHIKQDAQEEDIWLDNTNGYKVLARSLVSLGREQSIARVAQPTKGEPSFWINKKQGWCNKQFVWQDDYWAASVDESGVAPVRNYILDRKNITATRVLQKNLMHS